MFDMKSIVSDTELTTTFQKDIDIAERWCAYKGDVNVGYVDVSGGTFEASDDDVFIQYKLWQTRPERSVGKLADIEGKNLEELAEIYDELLVGAYIESHKLQITRGVEQPYQKAIDWLRTTDFYTAPASTRYHDNLPGGLLVHSLKVYNNMVKLHEIDTFSTVNIAEATIVALVHDWCKIGFYESYQRNVKEDGRWVEVTDYKINQKGIPLGHGVTSLYIAMKLFRLSVDQALAIRWHMGPWSVAEVEKPELQKANSEHPMVYLIQFADQLAATNYA